MQIFRSRAATKALETKWKAFWKENPIVNQEETKPKFYALSMFPYPSGFLHMGHVRVYTISDCIARFKRMNGYNVLHPIGWDAFGLPAENAAIERKVSPKDWTVKNITHMKEQFDSLSIWFDYDAEVTTCNPDYYKWTQWIFLQLYKKGLAYRSEGIVNWDPVDQTVLANEQVDASGKSWRSGALVEKKPLLQWYFRITNYAPELLEGLKDLNWPKQVKEMQKNWIGETPGWEIDFPISSIYSNQCPNLNFSTGSIKAYTRRPECIFGVTFLAISSKLLNLPNQHKIASAKNPVTGDEIPVYSADYVDASIGTGAVMGVPSDCEDDKIFSQLVNIPEKQIFDDKNCLILPEVKYLEWNGLHFNEARTKVAQHLEEKGMARKLMTYRLRDWLVSRQRYWGAPIPIIHCNRCGEVPVPESELPVRLPENVEFSGKGASPLSKCTEWLETKCPTCLGPAKRETDTLDTFVDSSWYFLRYADSKNDKEYLVVYVDVYVGGIEHAILHLLYSRFITRFLHEQNFVSNPEPFKMLISQGMVHGKTYKCPSTGRFLKPDELETAFGSVKLKGSETTPNISWEKMSKSKYNGADPQEIIEKYGADTVRVYVLFKAPPELVLDWNETDIIGSQRWLQKVSTLIEDFSALPNHENQVEDKTLISKTNQFIQAITDDLHEENHKFNTVISSLMKFTNYLAEYNRKTESKTFQDSLECLLKMMFPVAPHLSAELFDLLKKKTLSSFDIRTENWPKIENSATETEHHQVIVQVNGKKKRVIELPACQSSTDDEFKEAILNNPEVLKIISNLNYNSVIMKKGKFINFCSQ